MTGFLLRRLGGAALVLLALTALLYAIFYVAPGDVAQIACGPRCSPAQVAQVTEQLRLDDPVYVQYAHFLQGIVAGRDFSTGTGTEHCAMPCLGVSYQSDQQVTQLDPGEAPGHRLPGDRRVRRLAAPRRRHRRALRLAAR